MNRFALTTGIFALAFALLGCGGGGTPTIPDNTGDQPVLITPEAPVEVIGDHSVSIVPGQMNIVTGASEADLPAIVGKYGYEVVNFDNGRALLDIPESLDVAVAAVQLAKEYNIISAEPVHRINTPKTIYEAEVTRAASFTPLDPMYGQNFLNFEFRDPEPHGLGVYSGQSLPLTNHGFPGAWDVSRNTDVASQDVIVAIVDAGFFDHSATAENHRDLDETIIDDVNSGHMAGDGTFTAGLDQTQWDMEPGDPRSFPYRGNGEILLGVLAASLSNPLDELRNFDFNGDTIVDPEEVWHDGIAGINPNARYILIKTGELNVDTWSFTDNHIAESVNYLVGLDAADRPNIILLGMFGVGAVGANVETAIQNARDNDILVIAPAGDVLASINTGTEPWSFDETPVDITVSDVSPASATGCVSVGGGGLDRMNEDDLPDITTPEGDIPNLGLGWVGGYNPPFHEGYYVVASYCNTGADIVATAYGLGFRWHPNFYDDTLPGALIPSYSISNNTSKFGSHYSAAYVAGTASIVFQAMSHANGTPPSDDEVLAALTITADFQPVAGTNNGGILNASKAIYQAMGGGALYLPAMTFTNVVMSQPLSAIIRGTDLSATAFVTDGTAPFTITIDWGDGNGEVGPDPWVNGDPVTLTGGYAELGQKVVNITVTDDDGQEVNIGFDVYVINPLAANITITDITGAVIAPSALINGTQYRFNANAANVFTGEIDGVPNVTTFNWYFGGLPDPIPTPLPAPDATGASPIYSYTSSGPRELTLVVEESADFRPQSARIFTVMVNVL